MRSLKITLLSLLLFVAFSQGQSLSLDSLQKVLLTQKDTAKINTLLHLSTAYMYRDVTQSLVYGDEAVGLAEGLNQPSILAKALTNLGSVYAVKKDPQKGLFFHKKSLSLLSNKNASDSILTSQILAGIGYIHLTQGRYDTAETNFLKAVAIAESYQHSKNLGSALNSLGITYYYMGKYDKSLEYYLKGLDVREKAKDEVGVASSLLGVGNAYLLQEKYEDALMYYQKAYEKNNEIGSPRQAAQCLNNIGYIYPKKKDYPKALESYLESIDIKESINEDVTLASSYMNVGNIYVEQKKYEDALNYYYRALAVNEKTGNKNGLASTQINIGILHAKLNNLSQAIDFLSRGRALAKEIGRNELLKNVYEELSDIYEKTGDYKQSLENYKLYSAAKDSLAADQNNKEMAEMQTKYETGQKEKEIKFLTEQKELQEKAQAAQRIGFIVGILFLILLAGLMYNRYRLKQKANKQLESINAEIQEKKKEIDESIQYAKRIQEAILPEMDVLEYNLPESFVLYKPKDVVSGDFYWFNDFGDKFLLAAVDCTGHGVPGAFMSMIGSSLLNQITANSPMNRPDSILSDLHEGVRKALKQHHEDSESRDGMDISLIRINKKTLQLDYAGAFRPLYLFSGNEFTEIKADKQPIGGYQSERVREFTNHSIQLKKGDTFYIFSDGYPDQFGGPKGKKFMNKKLKELFSDVQKEPMDRQRQLLEQIITEWMGDAEQIDDILVIGGRV